MRILVIHAKSFSYDTIEPAVKEPEEVQIDLKKEFKNVLVVFTTVEENDELDVIDETVNEIFKIASQVKASEVLIYPYAHLSSSLAPPSKAIEILSKLYSEAQKSLSIPVYKAPFGWYKSFKLECYGHPLSELSRTITSRATVTKKKIEKRFYIMTPSGELHDPASFDYTNYPELKILVEKEVYGKELEGGENRVNDYCEKFGLEWEPMSDYGHMRYNPYGVVLMNAVSNYSWQVAKDLGIPVLRVMGTNMFNLKEKPVYEHALLFGDRLYEVNIDNERFVLRYAACHQQFAMMRNWIISYKELPLGVFEVADSYRLEQSGEVALCFRLRKFYMPDLHILTRDLREAVEVSKKVQAKIHEEARKVGRKYIALYNVTEDFLREHREDLVEFIKGENYPVLIAVLPAGIYYWVINVEYHILDNLNRPREIATFQIDIGNGKRFNITYVDERNEKKHPVIIHTALIGSIERYIYMILDNAAILEKNGETPYLPTWLAPIQVRLIPISEEYLEHATKIANEIAMHGFRVDVDDRDLTLGKKIREAGIYWIPYIIVIGEREVKTGTLSIKIRRNNEQRTITLEKFIELLEEETRGYPKLDLTLPMYLSKRPVF